MDTKELSFGERMKLLRAAKAAAKTQEITPQERAIAEKELGPAPGCQTDYVAGDRVTEIKPVIDPTTGQVSFTAVTETSESEDSAPEPAVPPTDLIEVQPNVRWVRHSDSPWLYHEEIISFFEDSGYGTNMFPRMLAALERAFAHIASNPETYQVDPAKMPEFSGEVGLRLVLEVVPKCGKL